MKQALHVANEYQFLLLVLVSPVSMSENSVLGWANCGAMWALVGGIHVSRVNVVVNFLFGIVTEVTIYFCAFIFSLFHIVIHFGFYYSFERVKTKNIKT